MIEMRDWHKLELNHREHYKDLLLAEVARARLVREALTGPVMDQAALRGILHRVWDLNLTLISVVRTRR